MTATLLDNDTEVFEIEDFETCCDLTYPNGQDCEHPARWVIFKVCCGTGAVLCTDCKDYILAGGGAFECRVCKEVHAPAKDAILYIEPLGKA